MLEVVRQRATARRRRRMVSASAAGCVVAVLALAVAVVAGGSEPAELRVAGSVEGGGASRGVPAPSRPGDVVPGDGLHVDHPPEATTSTVPLSSDRKPGGVPPGVSVEPEPGPVADGGASQGGSTPDPPPDTPVGIAAPPGASTGPGGSGPGGPRRVTVNPSAVDLRPRPFESAEAYGSSSVAVRFWGGLPECEPIGRVDVQETATSVTITLYTGRPPGEPQACVAIAVYQELIVELSAPLAGRTIVDGAA